MISVATMAGVPAWVRDNFGERVLQHANHAAMLDIEVIEDQDCFIPQATMTGFLFEIERRTAEPNLGLLVAPNLTFQSYGPWAEYVLAADTLRQGIHRAISTLGYHSWGDRMDLSVTHAAARLSYLNATRPHAGYAHVAVGTAGVMLDLVRSFCSPRWRPQEIGLDIPRPHRPAPFEEAFLCPVVFETDTVAVSFEARLLDLPVRRSPRSGGLTREDLARLRFGPAGSADFSGAVVAQVWAQVLAGATSVKNAAQSLDTSVRTLQRTLNREGTDYRGLVNMIRAERAKELLAGTGMSITEISNQLGYSAPASFARAFRKVSGLSPGEFRAVPWPHGRQ